MWIPIYQGGQVENPNLSMVGVGVAEELESAPDPMQCAGWGSGPDSTPTLCSPGHGGEGLWNYLHTTCFQSSVLWERRVIDLSNPNLSPHRALI